MAISEAPETVSDGTVAGDDSRWIEDDVINTMINPLHALGVDRSHGPIVPVDTWVEVNARLVRDLGEEAYLRRLLLVLGGDGPRDESIVGTVCVLPVFDVVRCIGCDGAEGKRQYETEDVITLIAIDDPPGSEKNGRAWFPSFCDKCGATWLADPSHRSGVALRKVLAQIASGKYEGQRIGWFKRLIAHSYAPDEEMNINSRRFCAFVRGAYGLELTEDNAMATSLQLRSFLLSAAL